MHSPHRTQRDRKSPSGREPGGRTSSGAGRATAGEVLSTAAVSAPPAMAARAALRCRSSRSPVLRAIEKVHSRAPSGQAAEQLKQVTHSEGDQFFSVCGLAPPAQTPRHRMQRVHVSFLVSRRSPARDRSPRSPPNGQTNRQKKRVRYRSSARSRKNRKKKRNA